MKLTKTTEKYYKLCAYVGETVEQTRARLATWRLKRLRRNYKRV